MINPIKSNLYKQSSKKYLARLLEIPNQNYFKQDYISSQICPYIESSKKPRLIEAPSDTLKKIQAKIKIELDKISVPDNVFSGIKGKSYIQNAKMHAKCKTLFKIDLTAFFPCITRTTVYSFFKNELRTSSDIANILTNLTTVDLALCNIKNPESIKEFILAKKIRTTNHLISGSPASQILSYLVNHKMFDKLQSFCDKNNITMSIYVDDITFSSRYTISHRQKEIIYNIISKHFYRISRGKTKYYAKGYTKAVTGSIILPDGRLQTPNHLSLKLTQELKYSKKNPHDTASLRRLRGLVNAARQCEPDKFGNIYQLSRNTPKDT